MVMASGLLRKAFENFCSDLPSSISAVRLRARCQNRVEDQERLNDDHGDSGKKVFPALIPKRGLTEQDQTARRQSRFRYVPVLERSPIDANLQTGDLCDGNLIDWLSRQHPSGQIGSLLDDFGLLFKRPANATVIQTNTRPRRIGRDPQCDRIEEVKACERWLT